MLDLELLLFLKTNLGKPTIDFKLSDEENTKIFTYLNKKYEKEFLIDSRNRLKIKKTFKEYFEDIGYILFKINEDKILVKVLPYKIEPKNSVNLPTILDILSNNKDLIAYNYNGNQNQISIPKKLKNEIYHFINKINNEKINKKELARFAVNEFFKLHSRDIVIIKDDQIFIKILDEKYKRNITENDKGTINSRYNGINEEDLKSLYDDFISKKENKNFFYYAAEIFVQTYMLEKRIDNDTYERKVFSLIQSIICERINNLYNNDKDFCTGFSGYIFRIHFEEVFMHIANFILAELAISNQHITYFLKYYSLNVVVVDGKKYKVPALETEGNLKWNVISMLSIVKIYIKTKTTIEILKKDIDENSTKIRALYIGNHSPMEYQNLITKQKKEIEQNLLYERNKVENLIETISIMKDKQRKSALESELFRTKEKIREITNEKTQIAEKGLQKNIITEYTNVKRTLDNSAKHLHRNEQTLEQNKVAYLSIKHALAKALVSKKTLIH